MVKSPSLVRTEGALSGMMTPFAAAVENKCRMMTRVIVPSDLWACNWNPQAGASKTSERMP